MEKNYYLISSVKSKRRNKIVFWKEGYRGYTSLKEKAGIFSNHDIEKSKGLILKKFKIRNFDEVDSFFVEIDDFNKFSTFFEINRTKFKNKTFQLPTNESFEEELFLILIWFLALLLFFSNVF